MENYKHGAYGEIIANSDKVPVKSRNGFVYVGTAPVHNVAGGAANINRPIVVQTFSDAVRLFGYSDDWAAYTLCEAMYTHLIQRGVGPLILINVLDVEECVSETPVTANLTPSNGRAIIAAAESIILDSVEITDKELNEDYTIAYDYSTQRITIKETTAGSLGTAALSIKYKTVDPSLVTQSAVIGESDGEGKNMGLFAVKNVYQDTGYIPFIGLCPGFSEIPAVRATMAQNSQKVNGHWDMFIYTDMPILNNGTPMKLSDAPAWKAANGYTGANEKVHFPIIDGTDGKKHHISVQAAANLQQLLSNADGIPYQSPSNTECAVIQNLYLGEDYGELRLDDSVINEKLNQNGITSAAYVGGRWAIWGAHTAEYDQNNATQINVAETSLLMMYYISNDFQHRRAGEIDTPMTSNRLKQIVAEEQARLDALVSTGALIFGECYLDATADNKSDMVNGDFRFKFNVTTTPLAKSMTAVVNWTDEGFATYFTLEGDA